MATLGQNIFVTFHRCVNRFNRLKLLGNYQYPGDENSMKVNRVAAAILGMQLLAGLAAVPAMAAGKSQTLTGEVSDAMCGAKHEMPGKPADCTRACIKHGSKYALVVGDKVYILETSDKDALDKLDSLAGAKAKVTGEVDGTTITVKSVAAGS